MLFSIQIKLVGLAFFCALFAASNTRAQETQARSKNGAPVQTIRGVVIDEQTRAPLAGASVVLMDTSRQLGAIVAEDGSFSIANVPVGRRALLVRYIGYEDRALNNLLVTSGKELYLEIEMTETLLETEEVVVTAQSDKFEANNELAMVSAVKFDAEMAARYAGSLNDPARMAGNFAGVASAGDTENNIVIRGNSPAGLLWRFEGLDIPNPNHFGQAGASGGPISILNNNVLGSSDFYTGAFAAQYGNATSGAFDLSMRNGNAVKRETMFQIGFNGVELMTEGPISKKNGSSYLISYRYSSLAFFDFIGLQFGDLNGVPEFQDLSVKINLPTKNLGTFSIFGMGGINNIDILESELDDEDFYDPDFALNLEDVRFRGGMGVAGVSHTIATGTKGYFKTVVGASTEYRTLDFDTLNLEKAAFSTYDQETRNNKLMAHSQYNYKFSKKHFLRVGGMYDHFLVSVVDSTYLAETDQFRTLRDFDDNTGLARAYAQHQFRLNRQWTFTGGFNFMYFDLTGQTVAEPRAGAQWRPFAKHSFSLAYGMHNQLQPMEVYFHTAPDGNQYNRDLDFTRSQHWALGYNWLMNTNLKLKAEAYYQQLDRTPVNPYASSFSLINNASLLNTEEDLNQLVSEGEGRNYGLELTLERLYANNYYFLITTSLFDSRYKASDGEWRNTDYNLGFVVNALAGAEKPLSKDNKHVLFGDLRLTTTGGQRYSPINETASIERNETVFVEEEAFSLQGDPYFRADVKIGYRTNWKKISQEFSFLVQNVSNTDNLFLRRYDPRTQQIVERYQLGLFPVVQYRIDF